MTLQTTKWNALGKSVPGANHIFKGVPNQDYIDWESVGKNLILAIADGHGSSKSFRSKEGSEFAVKAFLNLFQQLLEKTAEEIIPVLLKRNGKEQIPRQLVEDWKVMVQHHLESNPFTKEEWEELISKEGLEAHTKIDENPLIAYGSTLLGVVAHPNYIFWLQLGDGDILVVTDTGEIMRPIDTDPNLIGNETTSLCTRDAANQTRLRFVSLENYPPQLIMLSTDGYSNSYPEESDFLKVAADYLQLLKKRGAEKLEQALENFLSTTSEQGSGDDITVGLVYRADLFPQIPQIEQVAVENAIGAIEPDAHLIKPEELSQYTPLEPTEPVLTIAEVSEISSTQTEQMLVTADTPPEVEE